MTPGDRLFVRFILVMFAIGFGAVIGYVSYPSSGSTPVPTSVVSTASPCDLSLLVHDFEVLSRGYHLAITGHHRAAFDAVARNYAVLDPHECGTTPSGE